MTPLLEIGLANAAAATVAALVAALGGRLNPRPAVRHGLWLLVLVKFITPPLVSVPVPGVVPPGPRSEDPAVAPRAILPVAEGTLRSVAARTENAPEPDPPASSRGRDLQAHTPAPPRDRSAFDPARGGRLEDPPAAVLRRWSALAWSGVAGLWLAGTVGWSVLAAGRILRFRRLLRHATPASGPIRERVATLSRRLGLPHPPEVCVVPFAVSPLVWGMSGRARIVLPAAFLDRLGPGELDGLLLHELAHLRRRDHWVRWLELVVIGLYWWHPVSWWARRQLGRYEEQCCDSWVVRTLPEAAASYARVLVKTVEFLSEARPLRPLAASGAGPIPNLKRRVAMILQPSHDTGLGGPARFAGLLLAALALPVVPQLRAASVSGPHRAASMQESDDTTPELERRMERLEAQLERLERLLRADRDQESEDSDRPPSRDDRPPSEEEPDDPDQPDPHPDPADEIDVEELEDLDELIERSIDEEELENLGERIEELVGQGFDEERFEEFGRRIEEIVEQSIDEERLEELGERIGELVEHRIDTDRLEELGERIGELAEGGADPEQLEELGDEIRALVESSLDPEFLGELGQLIESELRESLDTEALQELGPAIESLMQDQRDLLDPERLDQEGESDIETGREDDGDRDDESSEDEAARDEDESQAKDPEESGLDDEEQARPDRREDDLDRRMRQLERRLEQLLRRLEGADPDEEGAR